MAVMKLRSPEKNKSILRRYNLYKYYWYVNRLLKLSVSKSESDALKKDNFDEAFYLITVAFNNTHVLKHQISKIKENITDKNYRHIIADNSKLPEKREEIKKICLEENIPYIGIPQLSMNRYIGGSNSHAAALNWIYYQLINKIRPCKFGFLDHDIYPLKPLSVEKYLEEQPFYGKKETREDYWYLWPGFCFFDFNYISKFYVDFSPSKVNQTYVDTGGALWYDLYSNLNNSDYKFAKEQRISLDKLGYPFQETVEFLDDNWFHSMNASLWKNAEDYSVAIDDILSGRNKPVL